MNTEVWKTVLNTNGIYAISNKGRIRREVSYRHFYAGRILNPSLAGRGYLSFMFHVNKKRYRKYIHTLVLEAFVGKRPNNLQVNHKDGNKLNNNVENLEWLTCSQNNKHAFDLGIRKPVKGNKHPLYKVPVTDKRHPMFGKNGEKKPCC